MKLIVGLGNPGQQYLFSRHNAGFIAVDLLAEKFGIACAERRFDGLFGRGTVFQKDCLLLKPLTFMNLSGKSVAQAIRFYKIPEEDIIVLHDDIDVPIGKVRARLGGGHGGHNGIRSIFDEAGIRGFHRVKLGVGRPLLDGENRTVSNWVLANLAEDELLSLRKEMFDDVLIRLQNIFAQPASSGS